MKWSHPHLKTLNLSSVINFHALNRRRSSAMRSRGTGSFVRDFDEIARGRRFLQRLAHAACAETIKCAIGGAYFPGRRALPERNKLDRSAHHKNISPGDSQKRRFFHNYSARWQLSLEWALETGAAQRIYMSPIIHISFLWCAAAAARYQNVTFLPCKKIEAENNKKRRTRTHEFNVQRGGGGSMAIFF
jgi:hypothetical protein